LSVDCSYYSGRIFDVETIDEAAVEAEDIRNGKEGWWKDF